MGEKSEREAKETQQKKGGFSSHSSRGFLHFFYFDPFSLSFLEPGTGYTTEINALIHVTLALGHLPPVDSAMEESSESESDLPDPNVSYCYTNGFLFHFGGSSLIL